MSLLKLLLTSGGVTNDSIRAKLEELLGKPIAQSRALLIPTAQWGQPACSPQTMYNSIAGSRTAPSASAVSAGSPSACSS